MNNNSIRQWMINIILAMIIMIAIPNCVFFGISLGFNVYLNPLIYTVASITSFCTLCSSIWFKVLQGRRSNLIKFLTFILLLVIFPVISIYSFGYMMSLATSLDLTVSNVGESLFGWVFGICIASGFEILLPRRVREELSQ